MKKIPIKLTNQQMPILLRYLLHTAKQWATTDGEEYTDDYRHARIMAGTLLYDLNIRLSAKYARYETQPTFAFSLSRAEASAFVLYRFNVAVTGKYEAVILDTILNKILLQL